MSAQEQPGASSACVEALVLQMLGARLGVASAIVASSLTYLLWNHPYAIVIFTTEAIVVAWLISRRRVGFVNADAIYWCCVGMPLVIPVS